MVQRGRRDGEFHRLARHLIPDGRHDLHETVLTQQQPRHRDQPASVRGQLLGTRNRRPGVVRLHLLQPEHGARQRGIRIARVHLLQHGLAVPHLHAARDHGEMRASGRRFRPAVAVGERGVVFVLPGFGRVAAQLHDERREVALVRPRGAEVLHDDGFLSRCGALFFQQPGKPRLALAVQDVLDVELARPIARGHVAEPDVHRAVLPHADGGHGGHAHAARELVLRHAVSRRLVGQREQVGDGIGRVLLGLRLARVGGGHHGHVHRHAARRDGLPALQVVGQQQVALLRRRVGTAHGIVRVRVHDVVQVHADAPHDLVLAGYLRAVLHQRRIGQRARRRRFDADRRKRLAVNREHDIVALARHVALKREEAIVQRGELRPVVGKRGHDSDVLTGDHAAVRIAVAVDHVRADHLLGRGIDEVHRAEIAGQEVIIPVDGERERVARMHVRHIGNAPVDIDAHVRAAGQRGAGGNVQPAVARFLLQLDAVDGHLVGHVHRRARRRRVVGRIGLGFLGERRRAERQKTEGDQPYQNEERAQATRARNRTGRNSWLGSHRRPPRVKMLQ